MPATPEIPDLSGYGDAVRAVGVKYGYDAAHAAQVAALAVQIFSAIPEIHRLGPEWAIPLQHAALLHDIGYFVHARGHHRHSRYLIRHEALLGEYPPVWRELVALVARNHRKRPRKAPREWPRGYAAGAAALASILRLADGLDYGHDGSAHIGPIHLRRGALEIAVSGIRLSTLHPVLADKARMFTRTFALPVTFAAPAGVPSKARSPKRQPATAKSATERSRHAETSRSKRRSEDPRREA